MASATERDELMILIGFALSIYATFIIHSSYVDLIAGILLIVGFILLYNDMSGKIPKFRSDQK